LYLIAICTATLGWIWVVFDSIAWGDVLIEDLDEPHKTRMLQLTLFSPSKKLKLSTNVGSILGGLHRELQVNVAVVHRHPRAFNAGIYPDDVAGTGFVAYRGKQNGLAFRVS
jgi:hypothetical protein